MDHDAVPTRSSLPPLRLQRLSAHFATQECSVVHTQCLLSLGPSRPHDLLRILLGGERREGMTRYTGTCKCA